MSAFTIDAKQRCFDVIERFPEEQLAGLAASLEAMYKMLDDAMDEAFCMAMSNRHAQEPDAYEAGTSIEELAERWGIDLEADDDHED